MSTWHRVHYEVSTGEFIFVEQACLQKKGLQFLKIILPEAPPQAWLPRVYYTAVDGVVIHVTLVNSPEELVDWDRKLVEYCKDCDVRGRWRV